MTTVDPDISALSSDGKMLVRTEQQARMAVRLTSALRTCRRMALMAGPLAAVVLGSTLPCGASDPLRH